MFLFPWGLQGALESRYRLAVGTYGLDTGPLSGLPGPCTPSVGSPRLTFLCPGSCNSGGDTRSISSGIKQIECELLTQQHSWQSHGPQTGPPPLSDLSPRLS